MTGRMPSKVRGRWRIYGDCPEVREASPSDPPPGSPNVTDPFGKLRAGSGTLSEDSVLRDCGHPSNTYGTVQAKKRKLSIQECPQSRFNFRLAHLTGPNRKDAPAHSLQEMLVARISFYVSPEFRKPIGRARFRQMRLTAAPVLMPKTSVNKDDLLTTIEY